MNFRSLLWAPFALLTILASDALAQNGSLDSVTCPNIYGWAWTGYAQTAYVDIYDGPTLVQASVPANQYRGDLAAAGFDNGLHGFSITPPTALLDHNLHQVYVKYSGTATNLPSTPQAIQCTGTSLGYTYYLQSNFGDPGNWNSYGTVAITGNRFTSSSPTIPGRWISGVAVPDGSSNYEVKTILSLKQSGGTYVTYVHATGDPQSGGSATEVALSDPLVTGSACSASLSVADVTSGSPSLKGQWTVPCADGMEIRVVVLPPSGGVSWIGIMVGGTAYWTTTAIISGKPGIGAIDTPSGNGLTLAALGLRDNVAPGSVDGGSVSTYASVQPTGAGEVDLSWAGVVDNPAPGNNAGDGVGIWYYLIYRDGTLIGTSVSTDFVDAAVNAGESHLYWVIAEDWHGNYSATWTTVSVTIPPAGSVDPRRVGVRSTGNYWGAMGEQIDTLSGNLNFSITLLTAIGRGGWSVPFGLSYNSQNWRLEGSASWKMGADVGYGFGWRLMAGSLKPYYTGTWTLHHFVFTDATGAEYRLDQQDLVHPSVWSSRQGLYVWYDYATKLLHFKDGSFWYMGSTSAGVEQDAGTMYPTLMQDTNGNQVSVSYLPGAGPYSPSGLGWNPPNTSARINQILDARARTVLNISSSYTFTYSSASDNINHITGITNTMGTAENYSFALTSNQALNSPFTGSSTCGSPSTNCGSVGFLASVTRTGVNQTTAFTYDLYGYGELTQVQFPYGGHLRWAYRNFRYAGGRTLREVSTRYLLKDPTATETTYSLTRDDAGDASRVVHAYTIIQDPTGAAKVAFNNWNTSPAWQVGLLAAFESRPSAFSTSLHRDDYAWAQDALGNPYVNTKTITLDQGTSNQRVSKTTTTVDAKGYGNETSSQIYDFAPSTPTLSRTIAAIYLHDSNTPYDTAFIRNRLLTNTLTPAGGSPITLVTNTYDSYSTPPYYGLTTDAYALQQHDPAMGAGATLRGNVTNIVKPSGSLAKAYDIEGNAIYTADSLGHTSTMSVDIYGNVPSTVTPNSNGNLSTSFSFNQFLAPTSVSMPSNGTSTTATYDAYGRPSTTTSPNSAVTHYYYCPDSCNSGLTLPATRNGQNNTKIVVVNTRWSRETYDGLGRAIRTERGDTSNNVISTVDTDYDSCGCSPVGKMVRTSMPYTGIIVHWTTYTYDGLGRTISVQKPDGASATTYSYFGSTTVVTDPKGSWKASTTDVYGNLVSLIEPDPVVGTISAPTSAQSCSVAPYGMLGTCYMYDSLNNLTHVDLYRNGYDQTRSFTYQTGTNWLLTATNPENGTVTYTRDAMGNVLTRVDALAQTTNYTYDTYNRLTQVARHPNQYSNQPADLCQTENYYYDVGVFGFLSGASWGKLTGVSFAGGSSGVYSVCPGTAPDGSSWGGITYAYSYSSAGQVEGKQMGVARTGVSGASGVTLVANWTYDNEGKLATMSYPIVTDPGTGNSTGTTFTYTYDTMGRPATMTHGPSDPDSPNGAVANNIIYNANDQMTQMNYGYSAAIGGGIAETRGYNSMFQVTSIADSWSLPYYGIQSFSEQYVYSGTQNNGQITQAVEGTGESVNYQYDQLNRLTYSGSTTGWHQQYTYDGFGNMTGRNPGGVGYFNIAADPSTNRMVGFNYDGNGNLHNGNWSYDVENRLVSVDAAGGEQYMYDPSNKRIYKQNNSSPPTGGETYFFYGLDGKVIGEYAVTWGSPGNPYSPMVLNRTTETAYFAGKKVLPASAQDRLGTARGSASAANRPYGENVGDFATYYQDASTGLDYADQRYYSATYGRFTSPDRYGVSEALRDPGRWNLYAYVSGDPVNFVDPPGLNKQSADEDQSYCDQNPTGLGCLPGSAPGPGGGGDSGATYIHNYWAEKVLSLQAAGVEIPTTTTPTPGGIIIEAGDGWYQVIDGVITRLGGLALFVILAPTPTGGPDWVPTVEQLHKICTPKGDPVVVPSTNKRNKGGKSIEQEYICPDGSIWTVHTLVDAKGKVIDKHVRKGPPKYGAQ